MCVLPGAGLKAQPQDVMSKIKTYMKHNKDLGSRHAVVYPEAFLQRMYVYIYIYISYIYMHRERERPTIIYI